MSEYAEKYFKYKNKYFDLKKNISKMHGGIIGSIDATKLDSIKTQDEIPVIIKQYINMMTIPSTEIIRVGSSMNKIQPFYSDIDVMNIIHKQLNSEKLINFFISNLRNIVSNLSTSTTVFFSDFKAGGLHWTIQQIIDGKNNELTLYNACTIKDVIKLDIIAPYDERYLEMSTFFILKSQTEYINVESNYFENFRKSLLTDIAHYQESKPFKAIKRVWSLARLTSDNKTLETLHELIKSNIALIAQVNSDIETIVLLIEHSSKYDLNFVLDELDGFRERLSTILDIPIDFEKLNLMIDNVKLLFKFGSTTESEKIIIEALNRLHNYLLKITNKETLEYLTSIKYEFPVEKTTEPVSDYETTEMIDMV